MLPNDTAKEQERQEVIREGLLWLLAGLALGLGLYVFYRQPIYLLLLAFALVGGYKILRGLSLVTTEGVQPSGNRDSSRGSPPEKIEPETCPHCGEELELDERERKLGQYTCPTCKTYVELRQAEQPTAPGADSSSKEEGITIFCPHCNEELEMEEEDRALEHQVCPVCSRTFKLLVDQPASDIARCPHCGSESRLGEDEWRRGSFVCSTCGKVAVLDI